ncbi:DUF1883 domain-containing protein [Alkalicoccus halolimnae]|uniref:DUF1883 domain-containing protein n=1 Tax=Alkalicoccus halolimnae TaxID=1667239 RepID=A0A5C7FG57_9BACI|nr:DUF1883 domain-containing protein [Alkalicoccus halolimnae]TXF85254.1 DUF1883 domain-containing protein [Alkalicoccus halolimnae]
MKKYQHVYKYLHEGEKIEVETDYDVRIMLMDLANFRNYQKARPYFRYGGVVTKSPSYIRVPKTGTWYIVVEKVDTKSKPHYSISIV